MRARVYSLLFRLAPALDVILAPLSILGALWSLFVRSAGFDRMPLARKIYLTIGVLPVRRHYYEPFFDPCSFRKPVEDDRHLPGIDLRELEQLSLLETLRGQGALQGLPQDGDGSGCFRYDNDFFTPGDAEFLFSMIRYCRPKQIIEIGSGNSTLMILHALEANRSDDPEYDCRLTCIEPYEAPWLEQRGVTVMRTCVEEMEPDFFASLESGDMLIIDSSHVIRPQGDVLYLYLQVLPVLKTGVFVHVHDILTPRDYFRTWMVDKLQLWNEQYMLEAFLSMNSDYQVVAALNFLRHHHLEHLAAVCPVLAQNPDSEPGSFWIRRL